MGQVPNIKTLVIGGGKMARHWTHYLQSLSDVVSTNSWSRSHPTHPAAQSPEEYFSTFSCIFLGISDDALEGFYEQFLKDFHGQIFHFSGAYYNNVMCGMHPLMTFGDSLYAADFYQTIPIVLDQACPHLFLQQLQNPTFTLQPQDKALYHSLCVMAGNFPQILWQRLLKDFQSLGIPDQALKPFLLRAVENMFLPEGPSLTGPLIREDKSTIEKHRQALNQHPFRGLYETFVELTQSKETLDISKLQTSQAPEVQS